MDFVPEWQIQRAVAASPRLLEIPGRVAGVKVREEQHYLQPTGEYVDLLCRAKSPSGWLIVELKADVVRDLAPATQALGYRAALAREFRCNPSEIHCMVAAPGLLRPSLEAEFQSQGVLFKPLDFKDILSGLKTEARPTLRKWVEGVEYKVRTKRQLALERASVEDGPSDASLKKWLQKGEHDAEALAHLGQVLSWLSRSNPIFAHEIGGQSSSLDSFERQWFWLFYCALDRRGNAALFMRGREGLEREGLFYPSDILTLRDRVGERQVYTAVAGVLKKSGVPLVVDLIMGDKSLARSIVEAAALVSRHDFDFMAMASRWLSEAGKADPGSYAVRQVRQAVYGMGPRSAAQFVRGMVLKGPWRFPLSNEVFVEETKYNALFAGPARLSIARKEYGGEAARFADAHMGSDKGRLSHALWVVRKRFCDKTPHCWECPVAGFCSYYRLEGWKLKAPRNPDNVKKRSEKQARLPTSAG